MWRTHSCVPCWHSCQRLYTSAGVLGVHTIVNAARRSACATECMHCCGLLHVVLQVPLAFQTLEFHNVLPLLGANRKLHLPRSGIHLGIFKGGFVFDFFGIDHRVSLDDVELIAMEVAGHVEPCLVVKPIDIHDQCVAVPMSHGVAHPGIQNV